MPRAVIAAKVIPFSMWHGQAVVREVFGELQRQRAQYMKLLNLTTASWRTPSTFTPVIHFAGGNILLEITTDDKKWHWLNKGTSVRYAAMAPGFVSKTKPGTIRSGSGAGDPDPIARGRRAGRHRGIEARQWSRIIVRMRQKQFSQAMLDAVARGLAKGHKTP